MKAHQLRHAALFYTQRLTEILDKWLVDEGVIARDSQKIFIHQLIGNLETGICGIKQKHIMGMQAETKTITTKLDMPTLNKAFTPGLWELENDTVRVVVRSSDFGYDVASSHGNPKIDYTERMIEAEANARLIAAAPELLEACLAIAALADGQGRINMMQVAGQARQAIEAATGKAGL